MEDKKIIALCLSGSEQTHSSIIKGVFEACQSRNIFVLMYTSLLSEDEMYDTSNKDVVYGESLPFSLVPFDSISGLIIAGSSIVDKGAVKWLVSQARKRNLPVITIEDEETTGCFRLNIDDEEGMRQLVSHVVEEHGMTRINFIGGYEANRESDHRLRAYKQVLEKNNIPVEEYRIGFGEFGGKTKEVLETFFDGSHENPQAIICANDKMAIQTICFLTERGYTVPYDMVVTGFDGVDEAVTFCPSITTARRNLADSGAEAVKLLTRIWKNKQVSLDTRLLPRILYSQTCGCQPILPKQAVQMYKYQLKRYEKSENLFLTVASMLHFSSTEKTAEKYLDKLEYTTFDFNICRMLFCIADKPFYHIPEDGGFCGYPEKLRILEAYNAKNLIGKEIKPGEVPQEFKDGCCGVSFVPIYYTDHTLGYLMMAHLNMDFDRYLFKNWLGVVSAQLGIMYNNQ